jgi:hypothetical protein
MQVFFFFGGIGLMANLFAILLVPTRMIHKEEDC